MARPTIADVAEAAGVSISTVDRVLNARSPVRKKTAERVMQAAESVGFYAANVIRYRFDASKPKRRFGFLLLQGNRSFYRNLAQAIQQASSQFSDVTVTVEIKFLEELTPNAVTEQILQLGSRVDALGLVAAEHPVVTQAIKQLRSQGVPCFALISALTGEDGVGYVGLDNWKVGRTAAWGFDHLCRQPGKIGILLGSHRYRCQEMNEVGFRSYFREHNSAFQLLEPLLSVENKHLAAELVGELLEQEPELTGLYITGGGITGVMSALQAAGRARDITVIGYELMDETRAGLVDGTLNMVISHPLPKVAQTTLEVMVASTADGVDRATTSLPAVRLPFDIFTPENL